MEWPRASVVPNSVIDEDLWIQSGEDPTLYVYALRMQGRVGPPPGWRAVLVPQKPINPLPLV